MKKIVLALALMMATMTVAAENILYFTYSQAARTVACLNNQDELMIYCGYADELPTYVLINEVWAEQISSSFYEIWLYGYDAYTGDEIYMPIDLECIYLMQNRNIYSAAQYLRFKFTHRRPTFAWAMPPYNPFIRAPRPMVYYYTYHYDIHRPGWHYSHFPHIHYHPYYHRHPSHHIPVPPKPFTPGLNRPGYMEDPNGGFHYTGEPLVGKITTTRSQVRVQNDPTNRSGNRITSNRGDNTITTTDRATGSRNTTPAPSRTGEVSNRGDNSNSRSGVSTDNNSRGTNTNSRSGVSTDNNGRGTNTNNRSGVSTDNNGRGTNTNNRSGVSTDNNGRGTNTNNRSGVSTDNNSRGTNTNNRSGASTDDNSRGTNTNNRSGVSSESNSRGTSSSTSRTSTKESDKSSSRSGNTTTTRGTSNSRSTGTSTSSSSNSNSRSGNTNNSRGSNNRTRN